MVEKISVTMMLFLMVVVIIASVLGTTYAVASLGLIKYPAPSGSSTGMVTVTVRSPAEVSVEGGKVSVNVLPTNETIGGATP